MHWLRDIRLPASEQSVRIGRQVVERLSLGLPAELHEDLRLLVSEMMTNAVRHGTPTGECPGATIRIRIGVEHQLLRVEVHDQGSGFEPLKRGPASDLGSGWGVHFVNELAAHWGTGRGPDGWVVWFELSVPHAADEPEEATGRPVGKFTRSAPRRAVPDRSSQLARTG